MTNAIWLVTLADRATGADQRVLVTTPPTDGEGEVRDFILRPGLTGTAGEVITLTDPVVIGVRRLAIKRPLGRTNFTAVTKAVA
jgi:hypothetical protein